VLGAFSSLTALRMLVIDECDTLLNYTTLGPAVSKLPRSLRNLKIVSQSHGFKLPDVSLIATHPGLRNLTVRWHVDESVRAELQKFAGDCKGRGLCIRSIEDGDDPSYDDPFTRLTHTDWLGLRSGQRHRLLLGVDHCLTASRSPIDLI